VLRGSLGTENQGQWVVNRCPSPMRTGEKRQLLRREEKSQKEVVGQGVGYVVKSLGKRPGQAIKKGYLKNSVRSDRSKKGHI